MTYKSFTTLDELFDLLVQRFWIKPPPQLVVAKELEEWAKLKQHVIQMRWVVLVNTNIKIRQLIYFQGAEHVQVYGCG
jgi:son of sevenless